MLQNLGSCVLLESFTNFLVDPYYDPLLWVMITTSLDGFILANRNDSPNLSNFLPAKHSHYTVCYGNIQHAV